MINISCNVVHHNCYSLQVTFIEALDQLMPGFDPEIGKLAQRVLINPRKIDYHTGVFASKVMHSFILQHLRLFSPFVLNIFLNWLVFSLFL